MSETAPKVPLPVAQRSLKRWNCVLACMGLMMAWAMIPHKTEEKKCLTAQQESVSLEKGKASRRW